MKIGCGYQGRYDEEQEIVFFSPQLEAAMTSVAL
jgi:hypothetical protein